jgi:hypothetical protein
MITTVRSWTRLLAFLPKPKATKQRVQPAEKPKRANGGVLQSWQTLMEQEMDRVVRTLQD